jgi:hypothetical protein
MELSPQVLSARIEILKDRVKQLELSQSTNVFAAMVQNADRDLIMELLESVIPKKDGMPVREWFDRERKKHREAFLVHLEDKDPGAAAQLQELVDKHGEDEETE